MTELLSITPDSAASLSDWETERAEHERRDAELRDVNKTAVFDALAAAAMISDADIHAACLAVVEQSDLSEERGATEFRAALAAIRHAVQRHSVAA